MTIRLIRVALSATALLLSLVVSGPASADVPQISTPEWGSGYDLRLGQWTPCEPGWATIDCIESVQLRTDSDTAWTDLKFVFEPGLVPESATQRWEPAGTLKENASTWVDRNNVGYWQIPRTDLLTGSGDRLMVYTQFMHNALQVNVHPADRSWAMREDSYVRVTLRTTAAQKYIQWTYANTHDPSVTIPDANHVVFTIKPTVNVHPKGADICFGDSREFTSMYESVDAIANAIIPDNVANNEPPAEVIIGTNGFWCFNGMQWDATAGQLVIRVGTVHFDSKGESVKGWIEAKIRGSLVRKWWGVNPKMISGSAKVEVIYENGEVVAATTSASYDAANDWIDLRSYGFHYSSPVVGIKVLKTAENTEAPAPVVVKPAAKKSITCAKGKATKKVTGTKCPSGWKKK